MTAIAQLEERTAFNRVVEGSSPSGGVLFVLFLFYFCLYIGMTKKRRPPPSFLSTRVSPTPPVGPVRVVL